MPNDNVKPIANSERWDIKRAATYRGMSFFLYRAKNQTQSASQAVSDRYHQTRLRYIAVGLRDLSIPLMKIVSRLEWGR